MGVFSVQILYILDLIYIKILYQMNVSSHIFSLNNNSMSYYILGRENLYYLMNSYYFS